MPNLVPLALQISPLPPGFQGTPQDLCDAIEARAQIVTDQAYSLFIVGASAPTSNEGPLFLNGQTPYVWDPTTGAYIPVPLNSKSLRYTLSTVLPSDNTNYDVVFLLDPASTPSGNPLSIKVWYNGAWTDIGATQAYLAANFYNQTQTNQQITNAIAGTNWYPFRAILNANQAVAGNSGDNAILFNSKVYDPGSVFNATTGVFTAPVAGVYRFTFSENAILSSGTPTAISVMPKLKKNGTPFAENDPVVSDNQSFRTTLLSADINCAIGDVVSAWVDITQTNPGTWALDAANQKTYFSGSLVALL